ncbi:MAG: YbjN domain-containing protein [Clostridia bacterium]|nr:YbjN domain-containing protein [Clostridia bacterium]
MTGIEAFTTVKDFLDERKIHYSADEENLVVKMDIQGDDLPLRIILRVLEDRKVVQALAPLAFRVPEDRRMECAVAVHYANYGMVNGAFDMDMRDGEIRFRATHGYRDTEMSLKQVEYLFNTVLFTADRYHSRLFFLSRGKSTLEEFIEEEES